MSETYKNHYLIINFWYDIFTGIRIALDKGFMVMTKLGEMATRIDWGSRIISV
jgi:hypothetical protein